MSQITRCVAFLLILELNLEKAKALCIPIYTAMLPSFLFVSPGAALTPLIVVQLGYLGQGHSNANLSVLSEISTTPEEVECSVAIPVYRAYT